MLGAALAACGVSPAGGGSPASGQNSGPGSPRASAAAATCRAADLRLSLVHAGAAGGTAGAFLKFTNAGGGLCSLSGFPVVRGITADGEWSVPFKPAHNTMWGGWTYHPPAPVVTLRPGDSAYAVVDGTDNPVGGATSCPPPFRKFSVAPPGSGGSLRVSAWLSYQGFYMPDCYQDVVSAIVPLNALQQ